MSEDFAAGDAEDGRGEFSTEGTQEMQKEKVARGAFSGKRNNGPSKSHLSHQNATRVQPTRAASFIDQFSVLSLSESSLSAVRWGMG